jgi:EthD domain
MPKLAYLLYRNPERTYKEFVRHYHTVHSPLAVEAMPSQTFYTADLADEPASVDGIAFLRLDDVNVLNDPARLYASHEFEERIAADGLYLFSAMHGYLVDEVVHRNVPRTWPLGQRSPGVKQISLLRRRPELDATEFRQIYEHEHGRLTLQEHPGLWRYIQNFVVDAVTPDAPPLDAITERHFRSEDDFRNGSYRNDNSQRVLNEDSSRFIDRSSVVSVLTRETIWI